MHQLNWYCFLTLISGSTSTCIISYRNATGDKRHMIDDYCSEWCETVNASPPPPVSYARIVIQTSAQQGYVAITILRSTKRTLN